MMRMIKFIYHALPMWIWEIFILISVIGLFILINLIALSLYKEDRKDE